MDLAFLNPLFERPGPWAAVYFDTSQVDENTPGHRELAAREVCRELAERGADQLTGHAVYEALSAYTHTSETAGRAVFASRGQVILDPPLTESPHGTRTFFSALPHVAPMLELAPEEPVCLIAYIDRKGADFELRSPLGALSVDVVEGAEADREDWPLHRTASADWSERRFRARVENTWEENAAEIAEVLFACQEETRADLLVLAGEVRERRTVLDRLPPPLRLITVESAHGGRAADSGKRLLDEDVARARKEHVRRRTEEDLDRLRTALAPSDGLPGAAEGVPALVEAAREHRIAELFVRPDGPDVHQQVWVGTKADQLAVRRTDMQYLGEQQPAAARADDALLRSAAVTGAEVLTVPREAGDVPAGGLGALLRWPYREQEPEVG